MMAGKETATTMLEELCTKLAGYGLLSENERDMLIEAAGVPAAAAKGTDLVLEGASPEASCLLLEGMTSRYKLISSGDRQITALNVPGDFVDLHSMLQHPMEHSVGCLTDCKVVFFPHARLREFARQQFSLTALLWKNTLVDAAICRQWLVAMGLLEAEAHTAHLLCELYLRLEYVGRAADFRFELPITQAELSDVLGLSPVHMNRTVQALRGSGLVIWKGHEVTITDWDRMAELAEFEPTYLGWGPHIRPGKLERQPS